MLRRIFHHQVFHNRVRLVIALAFFVLYDAAMEIEHCLADGVAGVAHSVGFGEKFLAILRRRFAGKNWLPLMGAETPLGF
jgi:hypothetical protein